MKVSLVEITARATMAINIENKDGRKADLMEANTETKMIGTVTRAMDMEAGKVSRTGKTGI
jgi:hypothetical protein